MPLNTIRMDLKCGQCSESDLEELLPAGDYNVSDFDDDIPF